MKRIEKEQNFRMMNKKVMKIAENGTWNDLCEWRKEFHQMVENSELLKGDAKILDKNDLFAEKQIKFYKRFN